MNGLILLIAAIAIVVFIQRSTTPVQVTWRPRAAVWFMLAAIVLFVGVVIITLLNLVGLVRWW
jgi:hypothetical protein